MAKHTKGQWAYDTDMVGYEMPNRQFYARIYAVDPGPEYDFTVGFARDADPDQRAANAKLMAAAPDLLSASVIADEEIGKHMAAIEAGEYSMDLIVAILCDIQNTSRAAIAKARGAA